MPRPIPPTPTGERSSSNELPRSEKCTNRTWSCLVLLSLDKKRPKHQSPDIRGAGKWDSAGALWLQQHSKSVFFWDALYG